MDTPLISRSLLCILALLNLLSVPLPASAADLDPGVARQIRELLDEKQNRTSTQQKIDSQLIYALKAQRGEQLTPSITTLQSRVWPAQDGSILVDVQGDMTPTLLNRLAAAGITVIHASTQFSAARLKLPLSQLENLAGMPEIRIVHAAAQGYNSATPPLDQEGYIAHGLPYVSSSVRSFLAANHALASGSADFQNINIGVISDSIDNPYSDLGAALTNHFFGPSQIKSLPGESGASTESGEGLAMCEVINAIAPGASLFFATGDLGPANMADNILQLSTTCRIIVDDHYYTAESPFQDGPIALAIDEAVKQARVFYFSASGNNGNSYRGSSGTWEGQFVPGGPALPVISNQNPNNAKQYEVHDYAGNQNFDVLTSVGKSLNLFWSDPLGHSLNDYDLFLLDTTGSSIVGASTNVQTGDQDPYEFISTTGSDGDPDQSFRGDRIVIVKEKLSQDRCLHLSTVGGHLLIATAGALQGHPGARSAFCVGAANASLPFQASRPFVFSDLVEAFSSDGYRRIYFDEAGHPFTPGNFGQSGGIRLLKPDFVAADDITTSLHTQTGLNPFSGSSCAAPQAAAIAAWLLAIDPKITWAQMRRVLWHSCVDTMQFGVDRESGFGALRADLAVQNLKLLSRKFAHLDTTAPPADQNKQRKR